MHAWQGRSAALQASQQGCTGASASLHIASLVPAPVAVLQGCMTIMTAHGAAQLGCLQQQMLGQRLCLMCSRLGSFPEQLLMVAFALQLAPQALTPCSPRHVACIVACLP